MWLFNVYHGKSVAISFTTEAAVIIEKKCAVNFYTNFLDNSWEKILSWFVMWVSVISFFRKMQLVKPKCKRLIFIQVIILTKYVSVLYFCTLILRWFLSKNKVPIFLDKFWHEIVIIKRFCWVLEVKIYWIIKISLKQIEIRL